MKKKAGLIYLEDDFIQGIHCKFYLDPTTAGGHFSFPVAGDPSAICIIGGNDDPWWRIVAVLLHECHEFSMTASGNRYRATGSLGFGSSSTKFFFGHDDLEETHFYAAGAMATVLPALQKEWMKLRKKR